MQLLLLLGGCPFRYRGLCCLRAAGHYGCHWDGGQHHNSPDTWHPSKKRRGPTC
jgi:hypothetical protein